MKTRKGFISNSSTTSFICDVCGELFAERDCGIDDAQMFQCVNEHTVCESHMVNQERYDQYIDSEDNEGLYKVPVECCPICQMEKVSKFELDAYLLRISVYSSREEVEKAIKDQFKKYDDFIAYLNQDKKG